MRWGFRFLGVLGALCLSIGSTPLWATCTVNGSVTTFLQGTVTTVTCTSNYDLLKTAFGPTINTAIDLGGGDDQLEWVRGSFGASGSISGGAGSGDVIGLFEGTPTLDGGKSYEL